MRLCTGLQSLGKDFFNIQRKVFNQYLLDLMIIMFIMNLIQSSADSYADCERRCRILLHLEEDRKIRCFRTAVRQDRHIRYVGRRFGRCDAEPSVHEHGEFKYHYVAVKFRKIATLALYKLMRLCICIRWNPNLAVAM